MRFTRALLLLSVLGSSALGTLSARAQEEVVLDEIVVIVGDYIVLKSDVDGYVLNAINQQQIAYSDELWQAALDQLIGEKILVIHAKRDTNIVVTDEQVDQMLNSRIQQMSLQIGGDSKLEELYGKSIVEIRAELREEFRDQLLAEQIRSNKIRKIKATPADVDAWCQLPLRLVKYRLRSPELGSMTRPPRAAEFSSSE